MQIKNLRKSQVLAAGAFAIFFTGFPHIWSVFQPYVTETAGWSRSEVSMCFYIYFVFFVAGNISGGRLQDRRGPRLSICAGGAVFTVSLLAAAFCLGPSPIPMYLTYGVLQGIGQGMIYTTIISTAQKWYPEKPGFASGVIVTANGLFGFFMAPVCRSLLERTGVSGSLLVIGLLVGAAWIISSLWVVKPPEGGIRKVKTAEPESYTSGQMLCTMKFYFLTGAMFFGLIPYMLMSPIAQAVQTDRGITVYAAVAAVMGGSVFNAAARLGVPSFADRRGRIACLKAVLAVMILSMVLLAAGPAQTVPLAVMLVYGSYGGIMGSFPSLTSSIFGTAHSGENYGYVMLGLGAATLAAPFLSSGFQAAGHPDSSIFWAGGASGVLAFLCLVFLQRSGRRRIWKKEQ